MFAPIFVVHYVRYYRRAVIPIAHSKHEVFFRHSFSWMSYYILTFTVLVVGGICLVVRAGNVLRQICHSSTTMTFV